MFCLEYKIYMESSLIYMHVVDLPLINQFIMFLSDSRTDNKMHIQISVSIKSIDACFLDFSLNIKSK